MKSWHNRGFQGKIKKTIFCKIAFLVVMSGWQDSNLRPPGPKPGAMTGLRYIPNWSSNFKP